MLGDLPVSDFCLDLYVPLVGHAVLLEAGQHKVGVHRPALIFLYATAQATQSLR